MSHIRISAEAERDIDQITAYTTSAWGWRQADQYLTKLEDGFNLLAENSSIGRSCDSIRAGFRRFEIGRHVVFYFAELDGVLVIRVLHQQMLPSRYV